MFRKTVFPVTAVLLAIALVMVWTTLVGAAPTTECSVVYENVLQDNMSVIVTDTWKGASSTGWHIHHFGDGTQFGFQGESGTQVLTKTYEQPGVYSNTFTTDVVDGDGSSQCTETALIIIEPPPEPTGEIAVEILIEENFLTEVTGVYSNTHDWGTILRWGHGGESVSFPGESGAFKEQHVFPGLGTYTLTMQIVGPGGETMITDTVAFKEPVAPEPEEVENIYLPLVLKFPLKPGCRISNSADTRNPNFYTTVLEWWNAADEWHAFWFGDESETKSEPPGFYGSEGVITWQHIYNPGTFTQTVVFSGDPVHVPGQTHPYQTMGGCEEAVRVE